MLLPLSDVSLSSVAGPSLPAVLYFPQTNARRLNASIRASQHLFSSGSHIEPRPVRNLLFGRRAPEVFFGAARLTVGSFRRTPISPSVPPWYGHSLPTVVELVA